MRILLTLLLLLLPVGLFAADPGTTETMSIRFVIDGQAIAMNLFAKHSQVFVSPPNNGKVEILIGQDWKEIPANTLYKIPGQVVMNQFRVTTSQGVHTVEIPWPTIKRTGFRKEGDTG